MNHHPPTPSRSFVCLCGFLLAACAARPTPTPISNSLISPTSPTSTSTPVIPPSSTPPILPSSTPSPTPTPFPAARQLTTGGCCVQPQFSPDGAQVWFIDKPAENQPSGWWGVDAFNGGEPFFVTDKLGVYSADRSLVAYPENGQAIIERVATGERWIAPSGGRSLSFSPDALLIAWSQAIGSGAFDQRFTEIWIANVDGSEPRRVARLLGGGFSGWLPDSARLLVSGRDAVGDQQWFLAVLTLADGSLTTIVRGPRLRGGNLSPDGTWAAFQLQFSGDATQDGLWVARTDGSEARRLDIFGAYRWRDAGHLLVVPLELNAGGQRFVEVDAATGTERPLTDPALTPIHIANGDWALSPDGARVVFVNAADRNLWVLELTTDGGR